MGIRQSLGLVMPSLTRDIAISVSEFTLAVSVQNITWGLSQAPVGAVADKWGLRPVMVVGGLIYVIGMLTMLAAHGPAMLTVSGGLVGIALSCTASSLAIIRSPMPA